ncbi:hypothetical protein N7493_007732 [Penicillium malachiteum]|uniref:PH domain-containing protein n=1 Tax=Penicillium malachiteum TaxID=1324776 RepID=A0AAD6MU93_9EURO|nr:hypothetical protein N7493_007732 [Penicillium malachiteum]
MQFRYSSAEKTNFPWETAIPITPFWDTWTYKDAYSSLKAITVEELEPYDLDSKYGAAPQEKKYAVILDVLREKLHREETKGAMPEEFYTNDYKSWVRVWLAIGSVNLKLGRVNEAEAAHRILVERRQDPNDIVPLNNLSAFLVQYTTRYAEGKALALKSVAWLDNRLGKASLQSIGARKNIAEADWKDGNHEEAEKTITEIFELVDELKATEFSMYAEDEKEHAEAWLAELKKTA